MTTKREEPRQECELIQSYSSIFYRLQFEWTGKWRPYTSLSFPRIEPAIKRLREEEKKMSNEGYALRLVMVDETITPISLKTVTGIPIKLKSTPNNNDTPRTDDEENRTPPCSLSSAALKVWLECEKDTPFFCRRSIDKSCYEVGRQTNEDWRECISEDRIFLGTFATEEEAQSVYNEHRIKWIWSEILQANE